MIALIYWVQAIVVILALMTLRLVAVLPQFARRPPSKRSRKTPTYIMIVLGSGGHTAEMLQLLRHLDTASYTHRRYIVSVGDTFSTNKATEFESSLAKKAATGRRRYGSFDIRTVARARQIHQSLLTTPITSLSCTWDCIRALYSAPGATKEKSTYLHSFPDIIVTNGPATATIMIFASLLLRFFGVRGAGTRMRCVYIESWARVRQLSLSGWILRATGSCDRFLVQWASLAGRGTEFRGQLIA